MSKDAKPWNMEAVGAIPIEAITKKPVTKTQCML
jgi:hypothetical protein